MAPSSNPSNTFAKEWLTRKETQEYLGVSKPTLARWQARGVLPFAKVGGKVYFRRQDILALLESRLVNPRQR